MYDLGAVWFHDLCAVWSYDSCAMWVYDSCAVWVQCGYTTCVWCGYTTAVRCGYTTAVRCGHRSLFSVVRCGMVATLALLLPDVARVDSPFLCPDMDMQLCRTMSARCHVSRLNDRNECLDEDCSTRRRQLRRRSMSKGRSGWLLRWTWVVAHVCVGMGGRTCAVALVSCTDGHKREGGYCVLFINLAGWQGASLFFVLVQSGLRMKHCIQKTTRRRATNMCNKQERHWRQRLANKLHLLSTEKQVSPTHELPGWAFAMRRRRVISSCSTMYCSALAPVKRERYLEMVLPALEKTRSEVTLVAGIDSRYLAPQRHAREMHLVVSPPIECRAACLLVDLPAERRHGLPQATLKRPPALDGGGAFFADRCRWRLCRR
ncbi:hypothetical protein BU14_0718s0004 [Porphyra umbilicalis]|uniref:Uncharacterized protein n=1 Tax=Porphyra umbilicalis TaxID=2786 RepID=A0A1X6NPR3_PORUM|nr:hypothetical protein BU14_0718s0004 [Porphyra umbilicalis]|eukprot:OSX70572.1 hypothetical protein BU14_0718s0004 [Porphyra umbilicalis]